MAGSKCRKCGVKKARVNCEKVKRFFAGNSLFVRWYEQDVKKDFAQDSQGPEKGPVEGVGGWAKWSYNHPKVIVSGAIHD